MTGHYSKTRPKLLERERYEDTVPLLSFHCDESLRRNPWEESIRVSIYFLNMGCESEIVRNIPRTYSFSVSANFLAC
jgi:hypothetical protein